MAIADVKRLKQLYSKLSNFEWCFGHNLDSISFFTDSGSRTAERNLDPQDKKDLEDVLKTVHCGACISWSLPSSAGSALKTIVLYRLNLAIKEAAREARSEAEAVLKELE